MNPHKITYQRNSLTGNWCAKCSCGWVLVEDREKMLRAVILHVNDTLWVEANPYDPQFRKERAQ